MKHKRLIYILLGIVVVFVVTYCIFTFKRLGGVPS